jgi:hypothetical protein
MSSTMFILTKVHADKSSRLALDLSTPQTWYHRTQFCLKFTGKLIHCLAIQ